TDTPVETEHEEIEVITQADTRTQCHLTIEPVEHKGRSIHSGIGRKVYATKSRTDGFEKKVTIAERAEKSGMTMEEVLTLASLIQAEAANTEDMYMVSSILHNRLDTIKTGGVNKNGEQGLAYLQLDSTKYYPYASLSDVPSSIRSNYKSKYSTYEYDGLPAGPICNPGMEAIQAALSPEATDYYYFCHKVATDEEPAVAYYAKTMDDHLENLRKAGLM
ncbi:MAG: endolytic transglycosylase MltG, partial [Clostridia bacterium]|nr:endolytic transglycosylase MltG [Clostridia bacterium]